MDDPTVVKPTMDHPTANKPPMDINPKSDSTTLEDPALDNTTSDDLTTSHSTLNDNMHSELLALRRGFVQHEDTSIWNFAATDAWHGIIPRFSFHNTELKEQKLQLVRQANEINAAAIQAMREMMGGIDEEVLTRWYLESGTAAEEARRLAHEQMEDLKWTVGFREESLQRALGWEAEMRAEVDRYYRDQAQRQLQNELAEAGPSLLTISLNCYCQ
jgi:hypothetical protein